MGADVWLFSRRFPFRRVVICEFRVLSLFSEDVLKVWGELNMLEEFMYLFANFFAPLLESPFTSTATMSFRTSAAVRAGTVASGISASVGFGMV